jgi:hypothetical protein
VAFRRSDAFGEGVLEVLADELVVAEEQTDDFHPLLVAHRPVHPPEPATIEASNIRANESLDLVLLGAMLRVGTVVEELLNRPGSKRMGPRASLSSADARSSNFICANEPLL